MAVLITPWKCPVCEGRPDGCVHCHGYGATDDVGGWRDDELTALPRPPAVMRQPCGDCAFRCGSPEQESDYELNALRTRTAPFYCHHGMELIDGSYTPAATLNGVPVGYMVCAGWWEWATAGTIPARAYRQSAAEARHEARLITAPAPDAAPDEAPAQPSAPAATAATAAQPGAA